MAKIYCKSSYLLRKDTAENWQNKNPILRKGEQGLETDTGIMKIGDGVTAFNSLSDNNIYLPKSYNKNIDQTYNPTSENAQSGIAVAEAVTEAKDYTDTKIGSIDTALDSIIALQNSYIGGNS